MTSPISTRFTPTLVPQGLVKLVDVSSYWEDLDVPVSVIPVDGTLVKTASMHEGIRQYVDELLDPDPEFMYLHINAMGAGEYYGSNKNGDYFPEEQLKKYHHTFVESAHIYRHHVNKDVAKSIGKVIFSVYNDVMHRVEVIAKVSKKLGQDLEARIAEGDFPQTSMGCKTPFDVCSICQNKAHTTLEYCAHIKNEINRVLPDGRKVMALNLAPLTFFDMSVVIRPADVTSSVLAKVAHYNSSVPSALVAADEGFGMSKQEAMSKVAETIKQAALRKMSDLVKQVEGEVADVDTDALALLENIQDLSDDLVPTLANFPLSETFNAFAELGAAPSVRFLAELLAYKISGGEIRGVGEKAELIALTSPPSAISIRDALSILEMEELEEAPANPIIINIIRRHSDASLYKEALEKRAAYQGYLTAPHAGALPSYVVMTPDQVERRKQELWTESQNKGGFWQALLTLGGAAILGRMYVSSLVDEKVNKVKQDLLIAQYDNSRAKIDFVKTAETASKLIDAISVGYFTLGNSVRRSV